MQIALTQSRAPGCVVDWSNFSEDNCCKFCHTFLIYWICNFYHYLSLAGVESGDQCLFKSEALSYFSGVMLSIRSSFLICICFTNFQKFRLLYFHMLKLLTFYR